MFREQFREERQRRRVHEENLEVYERLIEVCVDLWEIEREPTALAEAVETAEKSRARRLVELLACETLRPANSPPDLEAEFQALRDKLRRAELRFSMRLRAQGAPKSHRCWPGKAVAGLEVLGRHPDVQTWLGSRRTSSASRLRIGKFYNASAPTTPNSIPTSRSCQSTPRQPWLCCPAMCRRPPCSIP